MPKNNTYIYLVEGETEAKIVKTLKEKYIVSGKVVVLHQKRISTTLLRTLTANSNVILVFDTDVVSTKQIIKNNIETLQTYGQNIHLILIPQINNLEDELVFSTSVKNIKELLNSKSNTEFKSDLLKEQNCLKKLQEKQFDIHKFWSRKADEHSVFHEYDNHSNLIKIKNTTR
ncbi:MAG: hypothetical protein P1P65_05045 [Treponema sp.]